MIHETKAAFPYLHMNRKLLPRQFPRAPRTLLPSLYLLTWLKMPLEVVFGFLNALNMWFLKKLRVGIVDSDEDTCREKWEYKQINVIQSVPSFRCSLTGSSHQSNEGHSMAIPEHGSPVGWLFLVGICRPTLHSVPFCSLGGCCLWVTSFQLSCPLVSIRFGQWQALARDHRVRRGSTSRSELLRTPIQPPSYLLPSSDVQWLQSLA